MKTLRKGLKLKALLILLIGILLSFIVYGCGSVTASSSETSTKIQATTQVHTTKAAETTKAQPTTKEHVTESPTVKQTAAPTSAPTTSNVKPTEVANNNGGGSMVWIPKTGHKYHSNPNCSNMKNPSQVTINQAKDRGYTPCSKCYK